MHEIVMPVITEFGRKMANMHHKLSQMQRSRIIIDIVRVTYINS